jgi:hypothetical protein
MLAPAVLLLDRLRRLVSRLHPAIAGVLPLHILDHLDRGRKELVAFADLFIKKPANALYGAPCS